MIWALRSDTGEREVIPESRKGDFPEKWTDFALVFLAEKALEGDPPSGEEGAGAACQIR